MATMQMQKPKTGSVSREIFCYDYVHVCVCLSFASDMAVVSHLPNRTSYGAAVCSFRQETISSCCEFIKKITLGNFPCQRNVNIPSRLLSSFKLFSYKQSG